METKFFQPPEGQTTLVVLEQGVVRSFVLDASARWSLGRESVDNRPEITLQSSVASRRHGEFVQVDDQWFYYDRGSLNGTVYNEKKIRGGMNGRARPVMLQNGDVLRIDHSTAGRSDPRGVWMLFSTERISGEWVYFPLTGRSMVTIGRDESQCDLVQPLPYISAQHAKLRNWNGNYEISDCGSKAGTWVNGMRIEGPVRLREKDRISICDCHFIFTGAGLIYNDRKMSVGGNRGSVVLEASIISKKVRQQSGLGMKELIRNIKLEIREGELTAFLGESGTGKSTLMNCLNGTERDGVKGTVFLCGEDFYQNYDRLKYIVGNVPQKNILHETLSVEEELKNAAILRLPGDTGRKAIRQQVDTTLQALNLEEKRHTLIRKLSGGEQKRVNIGIELVADRRVLCLDEPDAGLDPLAKKELFMTLRGLAYERGKSVLVIIHDVSEIDLFDKIVMMCKVDGVGRLAFAGTPEDGRKHFGVKNLSEAYNVIQRAPERYIMEN